ncbi:MAG: PhzF family phenazine biosynthesis protein [Planctomycetota bacterium]
MGFALYLVDAFASKTFTGNPAAVVLLRGLRSWPDPAWMQGVALEMNQSETAFVLDADDQGLHGLRWFTPAAEVELCGHATLASAHALWTHADADPTQPINFRALHHGQLSCQRTPRGEIAMDFPAQHAQPLAPPAGPPPGLLDTLGLPPGTTPVATAFGPYDWIIELPHEQAVRKAAPDFGALARFDCRGVALTAAVTSNGDNPHIISRFFAPRLRISEDPVTGSLHCVLAPYWSARLGHTLCCEQASARGGRLVTRYHPETQRVTLVGRALTTVQGTLTAEP